MMAADTDYNVCFWTKNTLVDGSLATLTALNSASGHPPTELENPDQNKTWRSNVTTPTWINGATSTFKSAVEVDSIVLVNHNFDSTTTVRVELFYTPAASPEQLQYDQTFDALEYLTGTGLISDDIDEVRPYQNRVIHLNSDDFALSHQLVTRWRITFTNTAAAYFELGYIFVTKKFQPVTNFQDVMFVPTDYSTNKRTKGGQKKTNAVPKMRGLEINIPAVRDQNDIVEYVRLSYVFGKRTPVFVDCFPAPQLGPGVYWQTSEYLKAYFNLLYQVFGTMNAVIKISRVTTNFSMLPGRINIEENL